LAYHKIQQVLQLTNSFNPFIIVSFKEAKIMHIDANIEKDIWHGKNISIHAEKIKIYGKIIWDVSGKDFSPDPAHLARALSFCSFIA
jgi:hypothetical protein